MLNDTAKKIYSLLDLTSLADNDSADSIAKLCQKAIGAYGHVAAICVYPRFVKQVAQAMQGSAVNVATVVNFPHGTDDVDKIQSMMLDVLHAGANEVDMVFPYGQYLSGDRQGACKMVSQCKKILGQRALLKVILETGVVEDDATLSVMCRDVIEAGADFLKTSTGKLPVGATLTAARTMLLAIQSSKHSVGLKVAGGIKTIAQAEAYVQLAEEIMGKDWVCPDHVRIGASGLIDYFFEEV